ncbi:hypothetical protein [Myxococcus sp. RHSTA-1-4]|uniref:hypothetical protein n=1 Tax=Myxococcus sp. RHSTA-1-4 TaxID=2874601 RepID=UPI001CBE7F6F|nr:hypothetical protein [Myxococcus sp. RHSTA-1-4]MBZ4416750.1 hypothetical protein [Myxococcus sp. RHSTA-1-4]
MKLLGRDIPARELISRIEERLRLRGLPTSEPVEVPAEGVEPRVEPLTFNLHALEENADATRALPLHTHRGGAGQLVLVAKWAFRKSCQVFINEALGRQRVFNGHVRDSYAQLSAEVIRLRREVEELRARLGGRPPEDDRRPIPAQTPAVAKTAPSERAVEEREAPEKARPSAKPAPAVEPTKPPAKEAPRGKSASHRKPTAGSGTEPLAAGEAVLPKPRHARSGAGQQPRAREGAPRARPEPESSATPATGNAGQRARKPAPKQRGRRK